MGLEYVYKEANDLTKDELLNLAHNEGIELSPSMFERYIEHGLLVSYKDGQGYLSGVDTYYDERSIDAIKEINKLKKEGKVLQKDMIFILLWEGYPVRGDTLKKKLILYHSSLIDNFKVISRFSSHPDYDFHINEMSEQSVEKPSKIGRPSNEMLETHQSKLVNFNDKMHNFISGVTEVMNNGEISNSLINLFLGISNLEDLADDSLFKSLNQWLDFPEISNAIESSTKEDYLQCMQLLPLLKQFWDMLIDVFGSVDNIPLLGHTLAHIRTNFYIDELYETAQVMKFLLLLLLRVNRDIRNEITELLSNEELLNDCHSFCKELLKGGENIWETLGLPSAGVEHLPLQHG